MFFTECTIKIKTSSLKSCIDKCQKDCAYLKEQFNTKLGVDTNLQEKLRVVCNKVVHVYVFVDAFSLIYLQWA